MPSQRFFATAPKGIASLLADELRQLGAGDVVERVAGVAFTGNLELGYRACLWSRTAGRVLLELARFEAPTPEAMYAGVQTMDWSEHLAPTGTLAVDFHSLRSQITHTHFGALKVKDAIVDQFRMRHGGRPSVALERPDVRVSLVLDRDQAVLSLDLSGESLHRRGYRIDSVIASLKQNLAAALLLRCGWPAIAAAGGAFVDPMCGSGTLAIEAAMIAGDIAPGLKRGYYGFLRWRQFDAALWHGLLREAGERREAGESKLPPIHISDADHRAIAAAKQNVKAAGLGHRILIKQADLSELLCPPTDTGLVLVNPPYGERLDDTEKLRALYTLLGQKLRQEFSGWQAAVFTGNPPLGRYLGLTARRKHTFYNGAIECQLLRFDITPVPT
ncbi:MAG TPA: THUMP domain-containing protein [Gammaproteobacteria bacterium]|nr:THUMP domain-containing protein [Gammaproteobacteria bacterium]